MRIIVLAMERVREKQTEEVAVEGPTPYGKHLRMTVQVGELELVFLDYESSEERLRALEEAVHELAPLLLSDEFQRLGRVRFVVKSVSGRFPWQRFAQNLGGYVPASKRNTVRLINVETVEEARRVVYHELIHLAYPDMPEWWVERRVKEDLGVPTFGERFLAAHVFAVDLERPLGLSLIETGYAIPRSELKRLRKKRRSKLRVAVTEEGEIIYLSKRDVDNFWALPLLTVREYFSQEEWRQVERRLAVAAAQAHLKSKDV